MMIDKPTSTNYSRSGLDDVVIDLNKPRNGVGVGFNNSSGSSSCSGINNNNHNKNHGTTGNRFATTATTTTKGRIGGIGIGRTRIYPQKPSSSKPGKMKFTITRRKAAKVR